MYIKWDFIILGTKVLSPIKFLSCGHVARKIELILQYLKKTFKSACKTKQKWKKKSFFEKLKFSKKLFLDVKKINVFLKFTYFGKFGIGYWCFQSIKIVLNFELKKKDKKFFKLAYEPACFF